MNITLVLQLLGGIGMFLFGINLLSSNLQKVAGDSIAKTLEKMTSKPTKGIALGAVVTGVIQSSAASTIMVISFINAGIMDLVHAVPVIMGANIGTTITPQLLRLGDVSKDSVFLMMLRPSSFAPICVIIGAFMLLVCKKKRKYNIANIIIGFGILFIGMATMELSIEPLRQSEQFKQIFFMFKNPFLGVILGVVVTAILQSSSATVGVLQAISSTGTVTFSMAAPIVMGMNIGKCVTVVIASIGTNKKAKRAVLIDILNNVIGVVFFFIIIYGYQYLIGFTFWENTVNKGNIANFHTLFNIVTAAVLLPLYRKLIGISGKIIK